MTTSTNTNKADLLNNWAEYKQIESSRLAKEEIGVTTGWLKQQLSNYSEEVPENKLAEIRNMLRAAKLMSYIIADLEKSVTGARDQREAQIHFANPSTGTLDPIHEQVAGIWPICNQLALVIAPKHDYQRSAQRRHQLLQSSHSLSKTPKGRLRGRGTSLNARPVLSKAVRHWA